jgi:site-specific DNA-methyltransferase (adenine-specific)
MKKLEDYLYYEEKGPDLKIYHGDCLEVMPLLPKVDMAITSPPYNIDGGNYKPSGMLKRYPRNICRDWYKNDKMPEEIYQKWINDVIDETLKVCSGLFWMNHKVRFKDKQAIHPIRFTTSPIFAEVIWDRCGSFMHNAGRYAHSHEMLLAFGLPQYWNEKQSIRMTVWKIQPEINDHPCGFPKALVSRPIYDWTKEGQTVLDMFCGGGTTLVACKELNRNGIGIEISEKYCEIAKKRIKATTKSLF